MDDKIHSLNVALSQLYKRGDEMYHRYSVHCGLSDAAFWVLYTLYEDKNVVYTQNDMVSLWSFPKQTVNYAVSGMVKNGWIRLEQLSGGRNRKAVVLTEEGEKLCEEKIRPLMLAEERSLLQLTAEERDVLLRLNEKQCAAFEQEINQLTGDKND